MPIKLEYQVTMYFHILTSLKSRYILYVTNLLSSSPSRKQVPEYRFFFIHLFKVLKHCLALMVSKCPVNTV